MTTVSNPDLDSNNDGKADAAEDADYATSAGDSDTVDGKHASELGADGSTALAYDFVGI